MIGVLMSEVTPVVSVDWFVISKLLCDLRGELIYYDVSLRRLDLDVDIASVIGAYSLLIASTIDTSFRCIIWDGINRSFHLHICGVSYIVDMFMVKVLDGVEYVELEDIL